VIEDHRPLLARLRELAPQSELLTLSKGLNEILARSTAYGGAKLKFVDLVPNGGGHGQGNGTAGVEEAQVMTDYSELLLMAKILSADIPKLQR